LNTDAESAPEVLVNQSRKSVALVKKKSVGAKPKAARAAKTMKAPHRPPRSSRAGPRRSNWSADIAAATTSRRPSRRDATPDAAPASRSAIARPRKTRRPRALGRRKPQSSLVEGRIQIGSRSSKDSGPGPPKGPSPDRGVAPRDSIETNATGIKVTKLFDAKRLELCAPEQRQIDSPGERL
jgi:hypothetical protein